MRCLANLAYQPPLTTLLEPEVRAETNKDNLLDDLLGDDLLDKPDSLQDKDLLNPNQPTPMWKRNYVSGGPMSTRSYARSLSYTQGGSQTYGRQQTIRHWQGYHPTME